MVGGGAVDRDVRTRRIVRDHSAQRRSRTRGDIRSEAESVRLQEGVELIEDDTSADPHGTAPKSQVGDLAIVAGELDDQPIADCSTDQTRACAAGSERNGSVA